MHGAQPATPAEVLDIPLALRLALNAVCKSAEAFGYWDRPYRNAAASFEDMTLIDKFYWAYKCTHPIARMEKGEQALTRDPSAVGLPPGFDKQHAITLGAGGDLLYGEALEKVICRGLQTELKEARTGLAMGKKLEQSRVQMIRDDHEWLMTLKGSLLEFRNVKPPKTMTGSEESDDPEAREGMLLDRIGLLEMAVRTVDELFRMFLDVRLGPHWEEELVKIRAWVNKAGMGL